MQESTITRENYNRKTLRDVYDIVFRYKQKVYLFFFTVMAVVILGNIFAPRIYQSNAKLLIKLGRGSVALDPTATTGQMVNIQQKRESIVNSELEILTSEGLAGKVVDVVGAEAVLKGSGEILKKTDKKNIKAAKSNDALEQQKLRSKAAQFLLRNLQVEAVKKTNIVSISYDAKSPSMAQAMLSEIVSAYLTKHISVHRTMGSHKFFNEQTSEIHNKLLTIENKIREIKNKHEIGDFQEQRALLMERISVLQQQIVDAEFERAVSKAKAATLKNIIAGLKDDIVLSEVTGGSMSAADEMRKKLNALRMKEKELLSTFKKDSIPVLETQIQIKAAEELIRQTDESRATTRGVNQNKLLLKRELAEAEILLASSQAKMQVLNNQLSKAQNEINKINVVAVELERLMREKEILDANYRSYSESLEQTRIDNELATDNISNIGITHEPTYPLNPVRPRVFINIILGLFLGIFGGLGLAFFNDYLDHPFKKPEDIEGNLGLRALGALPALFLQGASPNKKQIGMSAKFNAASRITKPCETVLEHFLAETKASSRTEHVIAITSCHRAEGVSTFSAYFAAALANRCNGRVLLVDANLQDPMIHKIFGAKNEPGFADILLEGSSQSSIIQPASIDNLDLLCAGKTGSPVTAKLFESKVFADLLNYWKQEYSFVIIDAPAVWQEGHTVSLASAADGVVLLIEAESVRCEVALSAKERLLRGGADITGAVLNKRCFYVPAWLYKTLS